MRKAVGIATAALLGATTLIAQGSLAQTAMNHGAMPMAAAAMSDGEVRKIDKETGKITIKHGPIKNLDMPPMTMVFQARDPALLVRVKAGDKVRFTADKLNGAYTVLSLEPVP